MLHHLKYTFIFGFLLLLLLFCNKEQEVENPYDSINRGSEVDQNTPSSYSLKSVHDEILQPKCATPGCHDGSFEPNFNTLMSSYTNLVYHPITKNNAAESFKYRVVPFDAEASVLYERITNCCFVNENDRMPQDNIGSQLPDEDIERIKKWINEGAPDFMGITAQAPNSEPVFQWYWCIVDDNFPLNFNTKVLSEEDNRVEGIGHNPMIFDTAMAVVHVPIVSDDRTAVADLVNGKLLLSYDIDDFSNPIQTISSTYIPTDDGGIWYNQFTTVGIEQDSTVYMRYYINDGDRDQDTENPNEFSPYWFKSIWSFTVKAGSHE